MAISKKTREAVYAKYDGHCAYCGRAIDIKDMQVDHYEIYDTLLERVLGEKKGK